MRGKRSFSSTSLTLRGTREAPPRVVTTGGGSAALARSVSAGRPKHSVDPADTRDPADPSDSSDSVALLVGGDRPGRSLWPVMRRPRMAAFETSTEGYVVGRVPGLQDRLQGAAACRPGSGGTREGTPPTLRHKEPSAPEVGGPATTLSFPTSLIPPERRFSHEHDPTRVAVFSRP